jgi:ParB/RepB/Spo0J family partition protein
MQPTVKETSMRKEIRRIPVNKIEVIGERRPLHRRKFELIAESIRTIGLKTPITVRIRKDGKIELVAGLHRLEAMKLLGEKEIDCFVVKSGKSNHLLWQDGENLWRAPLSALEKAEAIARSTRNVKQLIRTNANVAVKGGRQPGEKGLSKSARRLGLKRESIRRAVDIDRISSEAKEAAKKAGLDQNQDALLKVAKAGTPEAQVRKVRELTTKPAPKNLSKAEQKQLHGLMRRLKKAKNLRQAVSNASLLVRRKFGAAIVKLGRSPTPNKSASQ